MKKTTLTTGIVTLSIAATVIMYAISSGDNNPEQPKPMTQEEKIKRGEYLVNAVGCDDCHSPKKMGAQGPEIISELRFSGSPSTAQLPSVNTGEIKKGWMMFAPDLTSAVGPWGQSYAANISSDATGIGNWKEEQFLKALREGKYKGLDNTRPLLPPMPWFVYKNFSDDDLKSIFAYLKSTKPVHNVVAAPKPFSELK
ncbi:MAG: c-type cytochrome [Bacteroidetes bacterium]|nr:MAG: c-type cytochrome [Bacteroidota bacterium]